MIAAFCDGCLDEFVSNDKQDLIDWVRIHNDHVRHVEAEFIPTVSIDPVLGIRKNGILQREGMRTSLHD